MKKIGIVTIHTDFNYGAVLQAVATQKFLELSGYDAEIINYENPIIAEQSKIAYKQGNKLTGYVLTFIRNIFFGRYFYYKRAIKNLDRYRKKSCQKYYDLNDLNKVQYDILIAGSDQIWNPIISRGIDPVFLLQFGHPKKRISISSSIGSYRLNEEDKEIFHKALSGFSAIGVREEFAREQLQPLVPEKIKVLCDPTLLLNKKIWWDNYGKKSKYADIRQKYIVTYFVGSNKGKYRPIVSEYAEKLKLPVWTIQYSNYYWKESDRKILGASIIDFIALITNAQLVVTDSFHGVAFSLNMGVNFVALTNSENPVRVYELLNKLDVGERIDMKAEDYQDVNKDEIQRKLDKVRNESIDWILKAIDN